jgi:hypothetical protein
MSGFEDSARLASAWRARLAAGYTGPITVELRPAGFAVILRRGDVVANVGTFHARYKADARAEQAARELGEATTEGW